MCAGRRTGGRRAQASPRGRRCGRTRLVDAGLLDSDGSLTASGREQLDRCRTMVSEMTQALTAGVDPAAVQTTIDTLGTVRTRAEQLLGG